MKPFIIIVIFVKLYNCAEIDYDDENGKPQNVEKNWIKPGLLDKIVENIQNSRKLLQLPNRDNFMDSRKKRCETCRESIRCKNQGKCELCNRICKDLDVPNVSSTDSSIVGNVQNNDFAQDAIKNEKSHRHYKIATVDPEHQTDSLKTLLSDLGKNNSNTVIVLANTDNNDMANIFEMNGNMNKTHDKPSSRSLSTAMRFHNRSPSSSISDRPTLADAKQPLIPELQTLSSAIGKNRFEKTNSILRSHRKNGSDQQLTKNSGEHLENHTRRSSLTQFGTIQNSNVAAIHENKHEFKRADQDRQTSSFKIDLAKDNMVGLSSKRRENQDESDFKYVRQFAELLKKLEEKVENIADLVKTTCGKTDKEVPDVLGSRFKETDTLEFTTLPSLENETQIPDVNSLIDDLQKGTSVLINKTLDIAKAIETDGDKNTTDVSENTLGCSKEEDLEEYVKDRQMNEQLNPKEVLKKIEPQNKYDYTQPEAATGQSKSDFAEEIVQINPEENVGNVRDARFRNNPTKSSSHLPENEEEPQVYAGNKQDLLKSKLEPRNVKDESVNWKLEDDRVAPKSSNRNSLPAEDVAETGYDATPLLEQRFAENEAVFGRLVPEPNKIDSIGGAQNSKVYFVGTGMQLPLNMKRFDDGSYQLSVDMDKLCNKCANNGCSIASFGKNVDPSGKRVTRNSENLRSKWNKDLNDPYQQQNLLKRLILPIHGRKKPTSNNDFMDDLENNIDKQWKQYNKNSFDDNFRGSRDVARQRTALVNNVLMWIKNLATVDAY